MRFEDPRFIRAASDNGHLRAVLGIWGDYDASAAHAAYEWAVSSGYKEIAQKYVFVISSWEDKKAFGSSQAQKSESFNTYNITYIANDDEERRRDFSYSWPSKKTQITNDPPKLKE